MLFPKRVLLLSNFIVLSLASLTLAGDKIEVKVFDQTGRPVVGATVRASWQGIRHLTDRRGEAKIKNTPKSRVSIVVEKAGYQPQSAIRDFSRRRQDISVTLKRAIIVPPPKSQQTIQFVGQRISRYGNRFWQLQNGDSEMRTKSHKQASAAYRSVVRIVGNDVYLDLTFTATELEGDKTRFSGTDTIKVYSAPYGKRIVGLKKKRSSNTARRLLQSGYEKKYGERHGSQRFPATRGESIWSNPVYTIDNRGKDADDIGMEGVLYFYVVLQ